MRKPGWVTAFLVAGVAGKGGTRCPCRFLLQAVTGLGIEVTEEQVV